MWGLAQLVFRGTASTGAAWILVPLRAAEFDSQHTGNLLWALASLSLRGRPALTATYVEALSKLPESKAQEAANRARAMTSSSELEDALRGAALQSVLHSSPSLQPFCDCLDAVFQPEA
ncbi:unnamed protein product [Effrenium voratum]|nr:unnamed protein product [Effrenium voratum]